MNIKESFFPTVPPGENQLKKSRRVLLVQGALAAAMFSLGTGNFLAGYLAYLGGSPAFIAQITAIPTLGCVLQMVSPFLFERLRYRKLAIVLNCFVFRFSMGFTVLAAFLFGGQSTQLGFVFALYMFSFLAAGFVTPALNQWAMQLGPQQNRGRYFAIKDIASTVTTTLVAFIMARQLDVFTSKGSAIWGYVVVYGFCIAFSVVDAILMCQMAEPPSTPLQGLRPKDALVPLKDKIYRPVLVYNVLSYFTSYFSMPFLAVYQLQYLQLSHTFITAVGFVCSLIGMAAIWLWGKIADKTYWSRVEIYTTAMKMLCNLGWFFIAPGLAVVIAPLLMVVSAAGGAASGMAGLNMQYDACPENGKTAYLGATAAIASLMGYAATMLSSFLQRSMEKTMGLGSMRFLFLASAVCGVVTLIYSTKRLPRKKREI